MKTRIFVLLIVFLAIMAMFGYITPEVKAIVNGCMSVQDQMTQNIDGQNCEE